MKRLLIVLGVLVVLLVAADRVAVAVAQGRVADRIEVEGALAGPPDVEIRGFPFLTQVLSGGYDEVWVQLDAEDLDRPAGTSAEIVLRGVQLPLSAALSGSITDVPVDRIDGVAVLPYDLLAGEIGPDTSLRRDDGQLAITRSVSLAGLDTELTAAGQVGVEDGMLLIDVENASAAGVEVPEFVVEQASDLLGLSYELPVLPFGLEYTEVSPRDDGVAVSAVSDGAVLGAVQE